MFTKNKVKTIKSLSLQLDWNDPLFQQINIPVTQEYQRIFTIFLNVCLPLKSC